ncbi:hypothetical protein [Leisingera sp. ANG-S5]|uniref:hypothetical protein n=1 Tax=Leisingera sp. ANG-S5 TaxID=1577901 RepID=UPI00057F0BB9|nr:hypothetical protein [Leisingera sp. ANG-S5]KIC28001.1 hypothetical protein RA25_21740 [Leisingera sp. ANG-S5]
MKQVATVFAKSGFISFLALIILAMTPMSYLPQFLSLAAAGWEGLVLVLIIGGVPFGGFLLTFIISRSGERLLNAASLAGFWIGSISGSLAGTKLMGAS